MRLKEPLTCLCLTCNTSFIKLIKRGNLNLCPSCGNRARVKAWKQNNKERKAFLNKRWVLNNPEKDKASKQKWDSSNKDYLCAKATKHRAKKLQATPLWANDFFIKEVYHLAKLREQMCGGRWDVDHIVPLKSKLVCGLHWEGNMQVIPAKLNQSKSNKYWPDMPTLEGNA